MISSEQLMFLQKKEKLVIHIKFEEQATFIRVKKCLLTTLGCITES